MLHQVQTSGRRFFSWLFGAPFRELPPVYGDPTPPELRAFEAEGRGSQVFEAAEEKPRATQPGSEHTRPLRRK